jgi:hypothetical protein
MIGLLVTVCNQAIRLNLFTLKMSRSDFSRKVNLMPKCPSCGAVLEIPSLVLGTDYRRTSQILQQKTTGADLTNEELRKEAWKASKKKPALSTILVNPSSLDRPILRLLYDRLKASPNLGFKLAEISYRLSRNEEGTEWLQKWEAVRGGSN